MKALKILLPIVLLFAIAGIYTASFNRPTGAGTDRTTFRIEKGQTLSNVAARLKRQELIRSPKFFVIMARLTGKDQNIKAGEFLLSPSLKSTQILDVLTAGRVVMEQFTVPEGLHIGQIASLLDSENIVQEDEFIQACRSEDILREFGVPFDSMEGFLFPDTYTVARGVDARAIVTMMARRFFEQLESVAPSDYTDEELKRVVIIASLVEREAMIDEERPLVAAVFYNRLANNKRLESCATVQYILGKTKERLLYSDLRTPSPYNTYLHAGLPPGPISNPGLESLRAALYPAEVDYLFFVSKGNGTHHFSNTYKEHLRAIEKYNRSGRVGHQVS